MIIQVIDLERILIRFVFFGILIGAVIAWWIGSLILCSRIAKEADANDDRKL